MHPFHEYIAERLNQNLRERRVVVWYDPRSDYLAFIQELRDMPDSDPLPGGVVESITLQGQPVALCCYAGSCFAIRAAVEPLVAVDRPDPLLIYLPGLARHDPTSVLMELEQGGTRYEPQLKRQARSLLRRYHSDGVIDDLLAAEQISYRDIVTLAANASGDGGTSGSVLALIFPQARDNAELLAAWAADPASDDEISAKLAATELYRLIGTRLGLALESDVSLPDARSRTWRYLLVNEFRLDLLCTPPDVIALVSAPTTKEQAGFLRDVITTLRRDYPNPYETHADQIEHDMSLAHTGIAALDLGSIDTFRFEEHALLDACDSLLVGSEYERAAQLVAERSRTFWIDRDVQRQAQWRICRLVADLGRACQQVEHALERVSNNPAAWVTAYTQDSGWYRVDQLQRQLESSIASLDDEPILTQAIASVRQRHDRLSQRMAEGFTNVLKGAGWQLDSIRHQTHIYPDLVAPRLSSGPVAYVLVDALRYEMGQELAQQIGTHSEMTLTPAVAALPTITKIGMAALLPDAATSFTFVEEKGKVAARIDNAVLSDLNARRKFLLARVPQAVEMSLSDLLQMSQKKLQTKLKDSSLIMIRSLEIDSLGEQENTFLARQVMDTAIGNVARAVRKLAAQGVAHIIITADHGHLFALERGDDMKTDNPGSGLEPHRRCWIGRGGSTPAGAIRVSGAELGYATDLDVIFPTGLGIFKAGGGLTYHHGGTSLQEMVIPVLTLRIPQRVVDQAPGVQVIVEYAAATLHNRTLSVRLTLAGNLFTEATTIRPVLLAGSEQVGQAGMAMGGEFDSSTGCVTLQPGQPADVGMLLTRYDPPSIRIVVQDPATDAVLGQTGDIPVELGM